MGNNKKYKWFSIVKGEDKRWHIGAFFCKDFEHQIYLMIAFFKWDIFIGKLIDWDRV